MKKEKNKNSKNEVVCEHCGKKIKKDEIIKLKLKNKKTLNFCKSCIDKIYDKIHFNEAAKYNLDGRTFTGYEISEKRYNKIEQLKKEEKKKKEEETKKKIKTPSDIKKQLDEYVIGQEEAKRVLSVAAFNHIRRISEPKKKMAKSNVFMIGPTGTGKTYLSEKLSEILDVPMITFDATTLTATGWRGNEISDIINALMRKADFDFEKCEKGIIHIDEIDKIAANKMELKDINGTAVQQMLLKFIEAVKVQYDGREINTENILFIVSGAFESLETLKKNNRIGFQVNIEDEENLIENLIEFGMLREFIGRFSAITKLEKHTKETLKRILTEPKNSLISQYQNIFKAEDIELKILDETIDKIAELSLKNKTGARGLKTYLDKLLLDIMYENLGNSKIKEIHISKDTLETQVPEIKYKKSEKKKMEK